MEDPQFEFGRPDSLLPTDGNIPPVFKDHYPLLRQRIRQVYAMQLKAKVLAILDACRQWKVRIVVFPEYSIPYDIRGPLSDASGEMVIVAGTHAVERERVERT